MNRLITIPFSHYCEKARWALERAGIDFVEEGHLPLYTYLPLYRAGAGRTVPALVTGDGRVLADSTDIVRWCDRHAGDDPLYPRGDDDVAALEDDFDRHLGPATRRLGYYHLMGDRRLLIEALGKNVPTWEARSRRLTWRLMVAAIRRGLRIDEAGVERSRAVIDRTFAAVTERLADGRPYLTGDRFTAADLTFAALAAPVVAPDEYARYLGAFDTMPARFRDAVAGYRRTPAGIFALRVYHQDRHRPRAVAA